ncbi:hypothetical protein Mal15_28390 [Stieleria maiorica]|uniref:WLM domain protein n=1 Tax=Stieleria maiorica TaxID=2795974 RepID=A0A5B9MDC8_9BACT|nr:hypothetical protein [Stieleria maiorica]QEF98783.1 hypothetical protein Mal15_28390 [Stieleria maiorica]
MTADVFSEFLDPFKRHSVLRERVRAVLERLPTSVVEDFLQDERFRVTLENFVPGQGWSLWMAMPGANRSGSRVVVLRQRLNDCNEDFALYIIAHEFAHAHLHNGGWGEHTDPEQAADALADSWGFPKVARSPQG